MVIPFALVPKALCAKDAAAYLGLSGRKFSDLVKFKHIPRQADGAFSIKHLDEYQRKQEAAAECAVYNIANGDLARENPKVDSVEDDRGATAVVHQQDKRGGRRQTGTGGSAAWPDI